MVGEGIETAAEQDALVRLVEQVKPHVAAVIEAGGGLTTLDPRPALGFLALAGNYVAPFGTPLGQVRLLVLLSLYVATLVWMRRMATGTPLPRFVGAAARAAAS